MFREKPGSEIDVVSSAKPQLLRLCVLRAIGIVAAIITIIVARHMFDVLLPYTELALTLSVFSAISAIAWLRLRQPWQISEREVFFHLMIDVAGLFVLIYFSGGSTNPFVSLLLFPLIFTATILPHGYAWLMAGLTVFGYSLLLFWYVPLGGEHQPMSTALSHHDMAPDFRLHVMGMWINFSISAVLVSTVAVKMMASIRSRDKMLAVAREENLRNERIIAVGTLAAGAAHELGTPLSTIAILCKEMRGEIDSSQQMVENLDIIRDQVAQCKQTLSVLLANADTSRPLREICLPLDKQLERIIEKWNLVRPASRVKSVTINNEEQRSMPKICFDQTLDQALINLLNNAADASPDNIEVDLEWDENQISIKFRDLGPGLTQEALQKAGKSFFTSKAFGQGLGIGLYLTNATIERFGGKVHLFNQLSGGAIIQVVLPIKHLVLQDNNE